MPPPYCYDYPRPAVTVDLAVFTLLGESLRVLLIRRGHEPFAGRWALPGGFLEIDEPIEAAARRELREETGFDVTGPVDLIGVFGAPGRDPRGRTISLAHAAAVRGPIPAIEGADDASEAAWLDPAQPLELAFDHDAILARALDWLRRGVADGPLDLALLPVTFSTAEAKALHRAVGNSSRAASAWCARLLRQGLIRSVPGSAGRYRAVRR
jgi:8-oxo-dGTP diphosphatase